MRDAKCRTAVHRRWLAGKQRWLMVDGWLLAVKDLVVKQRRLTQGGGGLERGGWGSGTRNFIYRNWPDNIFPIVKFPFSPTRITLVSGGGGGLHYLLHPTSPLHVGVMRPDRLLLPLMSCTVLLVGVLRSWLGFSWFDSSDIPRDGGWRDNRQQRWATFLNLKKGGGGFCPLKNEPRKPPARSGRTAQGRDSAACRWGRTSTAP